VTLYVPSAEATEARHGAAAWRLRRPCHNGRGMAFVAEAYVAAVLESVLVFVYIFSAFVAVEARRVSSRSSACVAEELGVCRRGRRWRLRQARAVCRSMDVLGSGSCVGLAGHWARCARRRASPEPEKKLWRVSPEMKKGCSPPQSTRSRCPVRQDGR
jgi:hypothetical protein